MSLLFNMLSRYVIALSSKEFSSVTQSCPSLCDPMNRSMPGLPVHHQLLESTQTHVHWVSDAIHLILCRPLLLLPSIFPSIRVFSNESALHIRWRHLILWLQSPSTVTLEPKKIKSVTVSITSWQIDSEKSGNSDRSTLVPRVWSGLCLPPSWGSQQSHLNSLPTAVSHSRRLGGSPRPVLILTQQPSLLALGLPRLVWLVQEPALEQSLAAWSLTMPGTHPWSSNSSLCRSGLCRGWG